MSTCILRNINIKLLLLVEINSKDISHTPITIFSLRIEHYIKSRV